MNRVFIDMDGVLADFDGLVRKLGLEGEKAIQKLVEFPNTFLRLQPFPGANDAVETLIKRGFDVWVATRPAPSHPYTYADKAIWIIQHFPLLKKKLIMTQDKGLLGDAGDILIDDRLHKSNCVAFKGQLIGFPTERGDAAWPAVLEYAQLQRPQ